MRAEIVGSEETLSKRVRQAEVDRVPYVLVLGDQEAANGTVALRVHGQKQQRTLSPEELIAYLREKVDRRSYDP